MTMAQTATGFRLDPPGLSRELMVRPRLLDFLQQRFRRRLTVVRAGPGFGKTSLLAQARAENLLAPRGTDVWLTCHSGDSAVSTLAAGLAAALGRPGPPTWDAEEAAAGIAAEVWRHSPDQVALLLDDAHLIPTGSPGAALLATLLDQLPSNGHLLIAGRDPLPVGSARLAAMGQLLELDESDLAFSEAESEEFASLRGVPANLLQDSSSWPALAELTVSTGQHRVLDYLWEELLARMEPGHRRLLALLALVGGADDEVAAALAERPINLSDLLTGLPLVGVSGTWRSLHPLWAPALAGELSPAEQAAARVRAAAVLRARNDVDGAVRQLARAGAWADVQEVICETAALTHPMVAPDVLAEWYELLPPELHGAAEGPLLLALVERSTNLSSALEMFHAAAADFRRTGKVSGEFAALTQVGHISWWLNDRDRLEAAVARADALAGKFPELRARAGIGHVWLADISAEWERALELLAGIPPSAISAPMAAGVDWLRGWMLLLLGEPDRARRYADLAVSRASGTFRATTINLRMLSTWLSGATDEALRDVPTLAAATATAGRALGHVFEHSQCALLLGFAGELESARKHLATARAALPGASRAPMAEISYALAEAAILVSEGDEDQARESLTAELASRPLRLDGPTRLHRWFPALTYILVPASRAHWQATTLPPALRRIRDLAAAFVVARERGSLRELTAVEIPEPEKLRAILPAPWVVELAVALSAAGHPEGPKIAAMLDAAARPHLKALARTGSGWLARGARELALALPPTPSHQLDLFVLGSLELWRDGKRVDHPSLQRDRVRQLLLFMIAHGTAYRHVAAAELWPDLDPDAAARNLRVTLNYTQRLLEPARVEGDPPFFLRSDNGMLRLTTGEWLSVDARRFDELLDEAVSAERRGVPSMALQAYQLALPLYRGDYLADVPYAEWATVERERLRVRYVTSAVRAGELLLATGDHDDALALGHAALRVDRWAESAYRLLMATHVQRGEFDAARSMLGQCQRMLAELGAPPDQKTQVIARRLKSA